jgi:two-component system invasion response regulator UvrY
MNEFHFDADVAQNYAYINDIILPAVLPGDPMIRTLLVDENGLARLGIRSILDGHADSLEIDEASSSTDLMQKLRARYYELIIVEPALSGGADTTLIKRLRACSPWSPVLVFTSLDELSFGVEAIRDGAKGYLMKSATCDELRAAVKRVAGGKVYLSKALAAEFAAGLRKYDTRKRPHENFSRREFQVFSMAVCGMTAVESAQVLEVGTDTVAALKRHVMARLQVTAPQDLAGYAVAQGLLHDCRSTASALWAGRYLQDGVARPGTHASLVA